MGFLHLQFLVSAGCMISNFTFPFCYVLSVSTLIDNFHILASLNIVLLFHALPYTGRYVRVRLECYPAYSLLLLGVNTLIDNCYIIANLNIVTLCHTLPYMGRYVRVWHYWYANYLDTTSIAVYGSAVVCFANCGQFILFDAIMAYRCWRYASFGASEHLSSSVILNAILKVAMQPMTSPITFIYQCINVY